MNSTVVEVTNWARPHVGRKIHQVHGRSRIDTQLRRQGLIVGRGRRMRRTKPFVVTTNGKDFLLASDWRRQLRDGEVLVVIACPPAGGGGGSRILAVLAIVALSIVTAGAAAMLATGLGSVAAATATTLGSIVYGVTAAAVSIVGNMLLNAIMPPPKPPSGQNRGSTSPNYSIGAQGNSARLLEAIPVLYGRFRLYPDFAAQPYTDYRSNEQYVYQLFAITQGKLQIEAIRIDETDVTKFSDVHYEVIPPGGQVTLFPDNVVSSEAVGGIALKKPSEGGDWSGPFVTNPPETTTNQIAVDVAWPGGLYRYNDKGKKRTANCHWVLQAQRIDDSGNAAGDWFNLIDQDKWDETEKPVYLSYNFPVAAGRYQVRMRLYEPASLDGQIVDQMSWQGLKAFLPSKASYGDVTMLAMMIKAGAQVNGQTSRKVNVIGTRILPVWDGAQWTEQATRSPAWAIADVFRNTTYGRGWPDKRINLDGLLAHAQTWAQRGDTYDGVFDTKVTVWDAVTQIARVGRAMPMYFAGVVEVIRDAPRSVPTIMITPDNMVQGSLKIDYSYPSYDTPDYVVVEYTNDKTWQPETVPCALTGSPKKQPKNVQLTGVTSRDQAFREGMYMAAANRDQRKFVTVQVEMEGYIPRYGDRIDVSHDTPAWGITGRILSYDAASGTLTTSEPLAWYAGQNHYVALRALDGSTQGPYRVLQGADLYHMVLTGLTDEQKAALYISDGSHAEPTLYAFGPGSQQAQSLILLRATPQGNDRVELYGVNYAASVHLAETDGSVPPPGSPSLLTPASGSPDVGDIGVGQSNGSQTVHLFVAPVSGAVAYEFEVSYDGGVTWIPVGVSVTNSIDAVIPPGTWIVRARAIGASGIPGGWNQNPVTVDGKPWPLGALQSFSVTSQIFGMRLLWAFPSGFGVLDAEATEIRYAATNDFNNSQLLATVAYPTNAYTIQGLAAGDVLYFWARLTSKSDGDPGQWYGPVVGTSSSDANQILSYLTGQITQTQLAKDVLAPIAAMSPDMVGSASIFAGDTTRFAGVWSQLYAQQAGDMVTASRVDTVQATVSDTNNAVNQTTALVQQNSQAVATLNGKVSAAWTVRCQVTADGRIYGAGMGLGVEQQSDGTYQSQFLVQADRFAVLNVANGAATAPFVIQGGQVFISQALIGTGWITDAMIGNTIQSTTTDQQGNPIWKLDKANGMSLRGASASGRTEIDGNGGRVYDSNGTLRVRWGLW